jgi:hypothetical protein
MIPVATTRVTIQRRQTKNDVDVDGYEADPPPLNTVAEKIRAVIPGPSASVTLSGGDRVVYSSKLLTDVCDLQAADTLTESDGTQWVVLWARHQKGLGLEHMVGEVRLVTGAT